MEKKNSEELEVFWKRKANCQKGKHKLKDNKFGVTWCVICGLLSNKPAPEGAFKGANILKEEDKIIWGKKII